MPPSPEEKIASLKDLLRRMITVKDWKQVLIIGEYLTTLVPEEAFPFKAMGNASLETNDLDAAEEYFMKALECRDADTDTLLLIARIYSNRGKIADEMSWLRRATEKDPDNPQAAFSLALTYLTLGEKEKTEEILKNILVAHPDHVPPRRALADIYLSEQKLDLAEEQLREAVKYQNKNSQLFADLGYILRRRKDLEEALIAYDRALELNETLAARFHDIGEIHLDLNDPFAAFPYLNRAIQMEPFNPLICYSLSRAYFDAELYDRCVISSNAALNDDPEMVYGRTNLGLNAREKLGLAYLEMGQNEKAEECFRKNVLLTASSYHNLGLSLLRQSKFDESMKNFQRAAELVPDSAEYWDLVGNAHLELDQLEAAQKMFEKAIEIDPVCTRAHYDLGVVFSRTGWEEDALKQFEKAIGLNENYALPYYAISCLYALQNRRRPALDYLRNAILRGFNDWDHIDNDHDLDSLRDDEEFQKIMEKKENK